MIVDGYLVTESIFNALSNGLIDVPFMIENTQYETDFSPYVDVTNITTYPAFAQYLDKQFIEWGPSFGSNLLKDHYMTEWNEGGSQLEGRFKLPVQGIEEILSSYEAKERIKSSRNVDAVAAQTILESWLNEYHA